MMFIALSPRGRWPSGFSAISIIYPSLLCYNYYLIKFNDSWLFLKSIKIQALSWRQSKLCWEEETPRKNLQRWLLWSTPWQTLQLSAQNSVHSESVSVVRLLYLQDQLQMYCTVLFNFKMLTYYVVLPLLEILSSLRMKRNLKKDKRSSKRNRKGGLRARLKRKLSQTKTNPSATGSDSQPRKVRLVVPLKFWLVMPICIILE